MPGEQRPPGAQRVARRAAPALGKGPLTWLDAPPGLLALQLGDGSRGTSVAVLLNPNDVPIDVPADLAGWQVMLSSDAGSDPTDSPLRQVPADTAVWLRPLA